MKKIPLILLAIAIAGIAVAQSVLKFGQWVVVNSSTTTPVALTNISLNVNSITLIGKKTYQTTNTSAVYIGFTNANGEQGVTIDPGGSAVIKDSKTPPRTISVSNIWLDVSTAGDGVIVIYD